MDSVAGSCSCHKSDGLYPSQLDPPGRDEWYLVPPQPCQATAAMPYSTQHDRFQHTSLKANEKGISRGATDYCLRSKSRGHQRGLSRTLDCGACIAQGYWLVILTRVQRAQDSFSLRGTVACRFCIDRECRKRRRSIPCKPASF